MDSTWIYIVTGLIALVILLWMAKQLPATSTASAFEQWQSALEQSQAIVTAGEQLYLTGKLPKDKRLDWATARLEELFPDLNEDQVRAAIESAVYWLKLGVKQLNTPVEARVNWNS